jgi:hypothetical protein
MTVPKWLTIGLEDLQREERQRRLNNSTVTVYTGVFVDIMAATWSTMENSIVFFHTNSVKQKVRNVPS